MPARMRSGPLVLCSSLVVRLCAPELLYYTGDEGGMAKFGHL